MKKIIIVPLDERPCNYDYAKLMSLDTNIKVTLPPINILGLKKEKANINELLKWILKESINAYGIIISLDMILYGGLVPSRIHNETFLDLKENLEIIKKIKNINPNIIIYGFDLIMRSPNYNNSDEEPHYYESYGKAINNYGVLKDKYNKNLVNKEEVIKYKNEIPTKYLNDYLKRREINNKLNVEVLKLVINNYIDFLIIPQDDASIYGYPQIEQNIIKNYIYKNNLEFKVFLYPGADEIANTLLARMFLEINNKRPKMYIKYSSVKANELIPLYEDRYLGETIKYHVIATNSIIVSNSVDADIILYINAVSNNMKRIKEYHNKTLDYDVNRTLIDFVLSIEKDLKSNKNVAVADVAYGNGGDINLFKMLKDKDLLFKLSSYAGWNTPSNTIGTTIPFSIFNYLYPNRISSKLFLLHRYIEDVGYQSVVREKNKDCEISEELSKKIHEELNDFVFLHLKDVVKIEKIYFPWNRIFEIGFKLSFKSK